MSKKRFTIFALVAVLTLAFAGSAFAAAYTWTGLGGDNNWTTVANWSPNNNYPGSAANDTATFRATAGRRTVVIDAPLNPLARVTAEAVGDVTTAMTIQTAAGMNLSLAGTAGGSPAPAIEATGDLIISGAGRVTNAVGATYFVDEDITLDIQVGVETSAVTKTGEGELIYSAAAVPAGLAAQSVTLGDDAGTFTIATRKLAGRITLGDNAVLNIPGATVTFNDAAAELTGVVIDMNSTEASDAATINLLDGAKVTLAGTGAAFGIAGTAADFVRINVPEAGELVVGTSTGTGIDYANVTASVNVADGGTLTVNDDGATLRSLNVEQGGLVVLDVPTGGFGTFTLQRSSTISGDITGHGTLALVAGAANQTFKLLGSNDYSGVATVGTAIEGTRIDGTQNATVEISGAGSLGIDLVRFVNAGNATLKAPANAGAITLQNDIITAFLGTIEVPANTELTLAGGWTSAVQAGNPQGLRKTGDGDLVLGGYQVTAAAGGIAVNRGTLVLANDGVAGTNPINVGTGASLRPGFSGITHTGPLTFAPNSTLIGLSEVNKDEPLITVHGAFAIGGTSLKVVTDYSGEWKKDEKLKVVEYLTAVSAPIPTNNPVVAYDANGNNLGITPHTESVPPYTTLSISPNKSTVYPEITIPAATTVKSTDLTFSVPVTVTSESGIAAATAEFDPAGEALTATIGAGVVTISGPIPEVDGTYYIDLTVTATSNKDFAGQASVGTITLVVKTDGPSGGGKETPVGGEPPNADGSISWTATITTSSGAPVTSVVSDTGATSVINALEAIGAIVTIDGATVKITGTLNDIGTGEYSIPILVNGTEKQTVKVTIVARPNDDTLIDAVAGNWKTTYDAEARTFVLYIPTDVTTADAGRAKDVRATPAAGLSGVSAEFDTTTVSARGADGVDIKVTGTVTDEDTAAIESVSYRIGINRYTRTTSIKLEDTDLTIVGEPGNGGGGCDAGFGAFSLLAVLGGAALLRRKG